MTDDSYSQARRRLELAVVDYYWEINPSLTRDSKEFFVESVVKQTLGRLK